MKIPYIDTNYIIWSISFVYFLHPTTIWDVLLFSIIKYESGNRPYLLSVFCVNWQLQFQEVLFFIVLGSHLTKHPDGSWPQCTDAERVTLTFTLYTVAQHPPPTPPLGFLLLFQAVPPVPSTCRPPLCHWEDRSPPPRPSAPGASGSVRWGPASQSANAGGPSWWCLSVPGCRPQPPRRSRSPWAQRGQGCGPRLARPGTALRGSVEAGTGAGRPRPALFLPPPFCPPWWACLASWSLGFPVRPRLHRQRLECDTRAGSRRCEGETGSGFAIMVVGHWGCWTLRWRALDCLSCFPEDKRHLDWIMSQHELHDKSLLTVTVVCIYSWLCVYRVTE